MEKKSMEDTAATAQAVPIAVPASASRAEPRSSKAADEPYSTFTNSQKRLLIFLVTVAATFSGFASNIYFPALPTIASDLNESITLINLTVTSYMVFQAIAPSFWGAIADVHGRRPAFICTFIVFLAACIGLANTQNYATLITLRCLQSAGSASTIALGSGVVSDIITRAERGGFMGIFQSGLLVPVAIGPVIGGAVANTLGWRWVFWFLAIYGAAVLVAMILLFPETLRSIVGDGSRKPDGFLFRFPLNIYQRQQPEMASKSESSIAPRKSIDLLSPLRILIDKRAVPIVTFLAIHYTVWQMGVTVTSTLFSSIYHLNETQTGLTFVANGVGSMVGTLTTGKLLDLDYRRVKASFEAQGEPSESGEGRKDDGDFPLERARLRLVPVFSLLQCASILVFGWTLDYQVHIAVPVVSSFVTGWAAASIQSTTTTYLVDVFPDNSASAGAALNLARCLLGAAGTAAADPMIIGLGIGGCFTLLTGFMLLSLGSLGLHAWFKRRAGVKATRMASV